jgi:hypothetical protein
MENNPKKSKAFIIAFILILLLLIAGYYLFTNRATIFDTKGVVTMQKIFAPLLGSSKNKDLSVIGGPDTSSTTGKTITGVITTDQNGNKVIQAEAGENLKKGDVLYIASFNKNNAPIVMKAIANDKNKSLVFGVAEEDMNKGAMGNVIIEGILSGVPTNRTEVTAWTPKNPLYLSDKIYGGMTKNPPYAPSFVVPVGSVISVDAINGSIRVGGIINDTNITADDKTTLNKLNGDFLSSASGSVRDYYDSVFGISNNNKVTVTDNNNGFILNPITVPGSPGFSSNLPTVTAVASPASIIVGGSSVISWISTKATVCSAGTGNGTGATGSFNTGALTKSKSFTISCTGANGSKSSGNTFVAVVAPGTCINKATNYPACDNITTCLNGATNPPTCDSPIKICMNGATNPPLCDNPNKICTNGSTNYPACDNILSLFPSVKVTAKPASIKEGSTTVISWTSSKAVSCNHVGDGRGTGTTGSFKTGPLTTNTSYSVVCTDAKGSLGSGNVYVTVSPIVILKPECSDGIDNNGDKLIDEKDPNCHVGGVLTGKYIPTHYSESNLPYSANPQCSDDIDNNNNGLIDFQDPNCHIGGVLTGKYEPKHYSEDTPPYDTSNTWPTIKVKATPMSITVGGTSTISWTSTNTTSCDAGIGTSTDPNGSFITEALSESRSYTITCKGDKGEVSSDAFVNVLDFYKFPAVTVTATPPSIDSGGSSRISWTSTNTTSCNAGTGNGTGISGSFSTGSLTKTTSYTVTCIGPNGQRGGNTSVSLNGAPADGNGKPQCSDGIDNNGNRLIDINEPNCHLGGDLNKEYMSLHDSEDTPPTECSDGIDNNGNGLIDRDDPNCHVGGNLNKEYVPTHISESTPPTQCDDGADNDGDGKVDAEDSGCHTDGDMTKEYVPTWDSEKTPPTSPYENTCKVIDSNPLEFTDVEKAQLDELLRKFYLIAPNLRTEDDINIAYSEITQYQNFSDHLKTLINQCYKQTADPAYLAAGGPTTRFGNPWYEYSTQRGSYIKLPNTSITTVTCRRTGLLSRTCDTAVTPNTQIATKNDFDCKYVSGWFSGNGADGKDCDTYTQKIYALNPASCSGSLNLNNLSSSSSWSSHSTLYYANIAARQGNVKAQQDIIYTDGLKNKCIWNPGAKIADLEKIFNVW